MYDAACIESGVSCRSLSSEDMRVVETDVPTSDGLEEVQGNKDEQILDIADETHTNVDTVRPYNASKGSA